MNSTPSDSRRVAYDAILNHAILTADQEVCLARRIQNGDALAKAELMSHNYKLVASRAAYYAQRCRQLEFDDLFSAGYEGLDTAAERFDPKRGFKFSTYSTFWIDHTIQKEIANAEYTIRPSQQALKDARLLTRTEWQENQRRQADVSESELAELTGLSLEAIGKLRLIDRIDNLDRRRLGFDGPLHESIPDPKTIESEIDPAFTDLVARALSKLPDQQREDVLALAVLGASPTSQGRRTQRSAVATGRSFRAGLGALSKELEGINA